MDIDTVARLTRISLNPEESARYAGDLESVLAFMATLDELDLSDVEPTRHVVPMATPFREAQLYQASADRGLLFSLLRWRTSIALKLKCTGAHALPAVRPRHRAGRARACAGGGGGAATLPRALRRGEAERPACPRTTSDS